MFTEKYSIFHLEGGLGKHVASTAVARCIKNNHPDRKLIVVCAYPELFINLDFVYQVYRIGMTPHFYSNFIQDKDTLIFKGEPYFTTDHINKRKSLIHNWCNMHNLTYNGELPELGFNFRQIQRGIQLWRREKPIFLIHTNGGAISDQPHSYAWTRDMLPHIAEEVTRELIKTHHVIQVCRNQDNFIPIEGVEHVSQQLSNMELFSLVAASQKRLLIDSCLQHAAAALGMPSTVLWVGTSPKLFGYDIHTNIVADNPQLQNLPDAYLFDYNFAGVIHECPYLTNDIFRIEEIIRTLK
jgi:hypothetical protein